MIIANAPQDVRAFVCDLYRADLIKGPLWKVYENGTYDATTNTVVIDCVTFHVEEKKS